MSDDNMNGDTPEIPAQLPPDRGLSPLPGPQPGRPPGPGGNGPLPAARAADYTSARNAREALQQLRQRQATILGLVFNRSIATRTGGYYYRYNNYYYYGHDGKKRKRSKTGTRSRTAAAALDTTKRP